MGFTGNSKCKKHFFDAVQNKAIILENVGKNPQKRLIHPRWCKMIVSCGKKLTKSPDSIDRGSKGFRALTIAK